MLPPYESDEVAEAVRARLEESGIALRRLIVSADLATRKWTLEAVSADGAEIVRRYPFTSRDGIPTPAEIAEWFAAELFPE